MARLQGSLELVFESLRNSSDSSRKQIFRKISYSIMKLYAVCTHSWVHTAYNLCVEKRNYFPKLSLFATWPGATINPQWLKLPISRTNFHGPKDVRAIEVWLYLEISSRLILKISAKTDSTAQTFMPSYITQASSPVIHDQTVRNRL